MSTGIHYDEGWAQRIERIYTTRDIEAQRQAVLKMLELQPGERVLDIGSGPGLLAYDMAMAVGARGIVRGVDVSESMLALGCRRCASLPWVEMQAGDVLALPYPDHNFDVVTVTQVLNYVDDLSAALREIYRALSPGGRLLILETDWDTLVWNTTEREQMRRVLTAFLEHCAHPYIPRTLAPILRDVGFVVTNQAIYPLFNPHYDTNTYSHGLIDFIASFVPGHQGVTADEAQRWVTELRQRRDASDYFFSLNRYLFIAHKPTGEGA